MAEFIADARAGLGRAGQKELPPKYFYDEVGSALFEVITLLPEYGLTRADARLLRRYAPELASRLSGPVAVAELGSGTGKKTRWVLEALAWRQPVSYFPIDISPAALQHCAAQLGQLPRVSVAPVQASYLAGLETVTASRSEGFGGARLLVLFLGSTIGNIHRGEAQEFLGQLRQKLAPGDALLLGTDLVKPAASLLRAYDDPLGVTAAFNLNLLARMNRELGADFVVSRWGHEARWKAEERRVEMHLRSLEEQRVHVRRAELVLRFRRGETIWTESCYKFTPAEVVALGEEAGFGVEAQWVDAEWPFAETLFVAR
ncbi:MAG: L-histidine N(alpha)-methyltransferase [Candidatus Acidiferrales bacterium]